MEKNTKQLTPEEDALEHILARRDKPFLEERYIDSFKGRGVFTHRAIEPSMFVVEYRGNVISHKDTRRKKKCGDALNNYLFEFSWNGSQWCIDASTEDKTLGRLVNDDHISPNCEIKIIVCEGKPHLCLFAMKEISPGEEITYSYGDSSYTWRSTGPVDGSSTSCTEFCGTSSTPRTERLEDSEAVSSCDDDELHESGPSHENDSFATSKSRQDFRDISPIDSDSSQEMSATCSLQPDDVSVTQQKDETAYSGSDGDHEPSKTKRTYSKNYCYLCGAGVIKISRHLFTKHADEDPEITKALALPKGSKERKRILDSLRNQGNYKHNQEVLKNNSGELRLRRRTITEVASAKTHVHCLYCKGMLKREDMWRHVARCAFRPKSNSATDGKTRVLSEIALAESRFAKKLPHSVWKMLVAMKPDEISFTVQNDFLLIQLAQYLSKRYRNNPDKQEYIRQKLREMGRLLIALHEKSVFSITDAIKPKNFYKVVEAVKDIAGFDEKRQSYSIPSLALKLGHSLKKIGAIVLAGVKGNEQMTQDTRTFMKLCVKEWSKLVSQKALASLNGRRVNKPSTIPFTHDVQVFYKYLETTSASASESLKVEESPQLYSTLCRVMLAQVSVLNKCALEVSKMKLKTFQERGETTRVLSKHFIRINIQSRTGEDVAVLLTSGLVNALLLLVSKREACGVHKDNPFLFAMPNASSTSHYHARNSIRGFSKLCQAKNPEHLRSVHLHKHIARVFQFLNLENDELCHLAKLLGHDIRPDRDYYRLPEAAVELAKIAKLLLAMEKGSLERFKGNSLEEIEIEDELEPDGEQVTPENIDGEEDDDDEESGDSPQESDAVEQETVVEKQGRQLTPEQDAMERIKAGRDKPFLEEKFIDSDKGRGVFARESIEPSTFVVEYRGNIIPHKETRRKKCGDTLNNYLFDFSWNGTSWRIDASKEDGTLGRLVNDDHISPNCEMKKIVCKGKPHLCLFAVKKISPGEEITYNYGDSSYPWRSTECSGEPNTSQTDQNAAASSAEDESDEDSAGASSSADCFSDNEYVPEDEPSSDDSYTSNNNQQPQSLSNSPDPDSSTQQNFVQELLSASCIEQEDQADDSSDDFTSLEPEDSSRKNKSYCYVCGKALSKISRHLFTHRKEDADIAQAFALPKHSKVRKKLLLQLRNRGNYKYNQKVLKTKRGELRTRKREPNMSTNDKIIKFAHCLYCKGMYSRTAMWRHLKNCSSKKSSKSQTRRKSKVLTLLDAAESTDQELSSDVTKLLKKLRKDDISSVVFDDSHILQLAKFLCHVREGKNRKQETITQRLRLMGRLLLTLKKKSIDSFEDAIKPENFSKVVEAVRELAGFNEGTTSGPSQSLMMRLGNTLTKVGEINLAKALKEDADEQTVNEAETFLKLCEKEWCSTTPVKARVNALTIPFIQDVQLLYQCMEKTAASAVESLTMYESPPVYTALLRVTVAQVSVLNKNVGEVSKITLQSFNERDENEPHEDAAVSQSQFEQFLAKHLVKITVKSSSGRKVAVTLTPKLLTAITLLVSKRESCGVHKENPFLFARPVAIRISFYHGQSCISTYVARCGAKSAVNLRTVCFRKHVSRVFQILSLTNDELDQLAKLLGRDIQTDREYYQTPEAAVDIAKISELLSAMENGSLERFEGKSLAEIEIADELEPVVEQDEPENPENSDAEEDNEESESSLQMSGLFSSKGSLSATKKSSRFSRFRRSRKRGRARRQESENEESDPNVEKDDEVNTEKDDSSPPGLSSSKGSISTTKKPSKFSSSCSSGKRGQGRRERRESENEESDVNDERNDEVNTEKDDSSLPGFSSSKGSISTTKKPSKFSSSCSSGKRGQGRRKRRESENEESDVNDERNDEVTAEKGDGSEEMPESCDVNTPVKAPSRCNEDVTKMSFSDDDEDMHVDFDMGMDSDDDSVRNEENDGDGGTNGSAAGPWIPDVQDMKKQDNVSSETKKTDSSPNKYSSDEDLEETMEFDEDDHVEEGGEQNNLIDVDSRSSSASLNTEKKNKLSAALAGMKEVKILLTKLDIEKLRARVHISQLSSLCNSVKQPVNDQPVRNDTKQSPTSSTSTDSNTKPSHAKAMQMSCSHCKKSMMMGQTAYQKKGFTDVFCSKNCLFEMFRVNKPVTKTCHHCHEAITQPLDLIMAAVDVKGTMKDFCSVTCLASFKSITLPTPTRQSICGKCNKSCTATCELTLYGTVHEFCSDSCFEEFRRDNMQVCDNCSNTCQKKPIMLKLEEETKTICSNECLEEFKEKTEVHHECTLCSASRLISDMVHDKTGEDMVELFCTRTCVISYRLRPANLQGKKRKERKGGKQSKETLNTEEAKTTSDSTVNEKDDAPPDAESEAPTLITAKSFTLCCHCRKCLPIGHTLYQPKNSLEVFCSTSCFSEGHRHNKFVTKKCYNCLQDILRPHDIILAPVDDSGTMKELCSNTCLLSVNSKRDMTAPKPPPLTVPRSECRMCARYSVCKFRVTVDGMMHRLCSHTCFINYHKINNLPMLTCEVCRSICLDSSLTLTMEDGSKTVCSEQCLVKFKEKIETPWLCPMCQTSHRMSDMVENENNEGKVDFFCSNRCIMVHKAQSSTVSSTAGRNSPTFEVKDSKEDIKEVKPTTLLSLDCIKQEPIDEEFKPNLTSSISTEHIKDEPHVTKVDLKIDSVFSLTEDSVSTVPTVTQIDLHMSCSNCKKVLMNGETAYQRKDHTDTFCSTPCLFTFYQMKKAKKTCHFCLQAITQPQDVLQAPVDTEETMKEFCSQTCISSFNYKRIMSTKIPIAPLASQSQCSMCSRYCISKYEMIQRGVIHKICSDPCYLRFSTMNNLSICENCQSLCNTSVTLKMDDGNKKLCSAECLAQFKQKINTPQPCAMCSSSLLMSNMVENKNREDEVELFCTKSCVMASKIQAVSAAGLPLNCDNCGKSTVPACHLAMSDASIRNFCTLTCAMTFKEKQDSATIPTGAADQTHADFLKPPEKLLCAQCRRILKNTPKVVQKKGKMNFVCSLACTQEFKRINNIMGKCEYCKNEKIIRDTKRVDGKDCYFCSDGCKMLFRSELEKEWGEHCHSCAYCLCTSKTLVTAQYKGTEKRFCSEDCNSNYNKLFCHVAKCDTCGREGKLRQSLPLLGEVKHFCDLKCVLHFCNKKVQMVDTVSSPPRSADPTESSPVITNVISLAGAFARQPSASYSSLQPVSFPDIHTKVVGHASVQTVPKELKNKSMLCTPLVHNKGVSCVTQTANTEAQTDNFVPKVIVLPLPLPVYVPLPMNMYSQYAPQPVGLPLPLPVPVFLPGAPDGSDPAVKSMKETIQPDPTEGELNFKSEMKKTQDEKSKREDGQKDRVMTKEGQRQKVHTPNERTRSYSDDLAADHHTTLNSQDDSSNDTSPLGSLSPPHAHKKPPPASPPALEMREDAQAPSPLQQTAGKVHKKNKGRKLQQLSKAAKEETSQRDSSKRHKLRSRCGIDAWKRWIQWRESQTNLDLISSRAVTFNEDVLRCSVSELSDGLCCFITEVKQPDGEPYSPDSLFYLCLSIQQFLFENNRMENIFSDLIYKKFSVQFTKILRGFKPSITAGGYVRSCVKEEFLWDCKQLGAYSPMVLLSTLLFFCCKYFGFTTVKQHRRLSFARIRRCTKTNQDNTKTSFLRFYPPHEAESDGVPAKRRKKEESNEDNILEMMENTENPLRCPVRLYEFYLSKCSLSVRRRTDLFYLQPDRSCLPSSPLWFSSAPLDSSTMEAMHVRILAIRELHQEDGRCGDQQTSDDEGDSE